MKGQARFFVILGIIALFILILWSGILGTKITQTNNITNNITIFNNTVNNITVTNNITVNTTNNITNNFTVAFSGLFPASNITNGTFGSADQNTSDFVFPHDLNVTNNLTTRNLSVRDSLNVISRTSNATLTINYVTAGLSINQSGQPSGFMYFMTNAINPQISAGNATGTGQFFIDMRGARPICLNCLQTGIVETGGQMVIDTRLNVTTETRIGGIAGDGSGKVVCIKADGDLGTCSSIVGVGGTCTCG